MCVCACVCVCVCGVDDVDDGYTRLENAPLERRHKGSSKASKEAAVKQSNFDASYARLVYARLERRHPP